jgi:hypothetical protein
MCLLEKRVLAAIRDRVEIENEIAIIYDEYQRLKLKILGYTWGNDGNYGTTFTQVSEVCIIESITEKHITINPNRYNELVMPTVWVSNPNWQDEATEILKEILGHNLLEKLSE